MHKLQPCEENHKYNDEQSGSHTLSWIKKLSAFTQEGKSVNNANACKNWKAQLYWRKSTWNYDHSYAFKKFIILSFEKTRREGTTHTYKGQTKGNKRTT